MCIVGHIGLDGCCCCCCQMSMMMREGMRCHNCIDKGRTKMSRLFASSLTNNSQGFCGVIKKLQNRLSYLKLKIFFLDNKYTESFFTARSTIMQSAVLRSHVFCPSACPSVTLVDHDCISWKSWRLIARAISPTSSLFIAHRSSTYSQRTLRNFGEKMFVQHLHP